LEKERWEERYSEEKERWEERYSEEKERWEERWGLSVVKACRQKLYSKL
jgi:hypothetical protein